MYLYDEQVLGIDGSNPAYFGLSDVGGGNHDESRYGNILWAWVLKRERIDSEVGAGD